MHQHILYNFATRQRAKQFYEVLDKMRELSATDNYTVLVKLDITDKTDYNEQRLKESYPEVTLLRANHESKIEAINNGVYASDIIVNISDDIRFTAKHFDNMIREYCGADDFVLFPEPYAESQHSKGKNERIAVVSVIGIEYFSRFNYVYFPGYKSFFCDNEQTQVARIIGRLKEVNDIIFYHKHPTAGYKNNDQLYTQNMRWWQHDKEIYYERRAIDFGLKQQVISKSI